MINSKILIEILTFALIVPFVARKTLKNDKLKLITSIFFLFFAIHNLAFVKEFTPTKTWIILLAFLTLLYCKNTRQIFGTKEFLKCCICAPFIEEFVYRKLLISKLVNELGNFWAVLIGALVFGLAHCEFEKQSIDKFGYTFAFGLVAGWLWIIDGKILISPFTCHLVCNLFGFPEFLVRA